MQAVVNPVPLQPLPAPPAAPGNGRPAEADKQAMEAPVAKTDLNPLYLEVNALEMLYQLRITRPQLEQLAKLAPTTAGPAPAPREVVVSAQLATALKKLHDAFLDNDDDAVGSLSGEIEDLRSKENPEFDEVAITDEARKQVPALLRSLSARQVASYVTDYADDFPDPREKLVDALDEIRKLPAREWEEVRDEVAGQVGWLVAGLDVAAEQKVATRVVELLNRVKGLKDDEYKAMRAALERASSDIVGNVGPTDVIRHFVERSLAELLSNPRLASAVAGRLRRAD
jgi:hypothetical protein